jgi:hypothetical protein
MRPGGTDASSPAIYRRDPSPHGLRPGGTPEFGVWVGGISHLEPIRHAGLVATQIQLQVSLRDADPIDSQPGDKSPGYYRVSLRDEGKTARRAYTGWKPANSSVFGKVKSRKRNVRLASIPIEVRFPRGRTPSSLMA